MRALLIIAAAIAACGPVARGQRVDPDFVARVADPAYGAGAGPRVTIDEAHGELHRAAGTYAPFAALLRADGYVVEPGRAIPRDGVLVIANATLAHGAAEIAAIHAWVERGGALLLITDHAPLPAAADGLARAFGVELDDGVAGAGAAPRTAREISYRPGAGLADAAITRGLGEVVTFTGCAFRAPRAQPLLRFGAGATAFDRNGRARRSIAGWMQAAAIELGRGRVVVACEAAMFTAQIAADGSRIGLGAADDARFVRRVIAWLSSGDR